MPAQLESTQEDAFAVAFATSASTRRTTSSQRDTMKREFQLELMARDFVRWFPVEAREVEQAGLRKLREQFAA